LADVDLKFHAIWMRTIIPVSPGSTNQVIGEKSMKRRDFLTFSVAATIVPVSAMAQQEKPMPVVGILAAASSQNVGTQRVLARFREALAETGFI
jgi:hypothetical protein